jgi:hypothetical protein
MHRAMNGSSADLHQRARRTVVIVRALALGFDASVDVCR